MAVGGAGLGGLMAGVLAGCAGPNLQDEAEELADSLRQENGINDVDVDYNDPEFLDSGKVVMTVTMDESVTPEQIGDVVGTVYEAFRTTHHGEEGDVDVIAGDDMVHVRSFESEPSTRSVVDEAVAVLALRDRGAVEVRIDAQSPKSATDVGSDNVLTLGPNTTAEDVVAELPVIERELGNPDERRWTVAAATGDSIGSEPGLPTAGILARWQRLRVSADRLGDASVVFEELGPDDLSRWAQVDVPGLDPQVRPQRTASIVQNQIDLIRLDNDLWVYELTSDGASVSWIDPMICRPQEPTVDRVNPVDDALRTAENCLGEKYAEDVEAPE